MSGSPLKKFILTPAIISGSVFAVLTVPLAVLGNQQITIQLQKDTVFYGKLRDVASPYLGLASIFALGAGVASVAMAGWQQSSRKSEQIEAQLSGLTQHLKEKEAQLQALKLSEPRVEASGLGAFLDEEAPYIETTKESPQETPAIVADTPFVVEEFAIAPQSLPSQATASPNMSVQGTTAKFACTQTFLGYAQGKGTHQPDINISQTHKDVEQLQAQLQQLMAQMVSVQTALAAKNQGSPTAVQSSTKVKVVPLQPTQSWSVH